MKPRSACDFKRWASIIACEKKSVRSAILNTRNFLSIIAMASLLVGSPASASEAESAKQAAVERYFRAMPMSKMMEDMYSEIAKQLPPERRSTFLIEIRKVVPAERLEKIATAAMLKTYSTEEINALADFYSSPYGASAMAKFGAYMSEIMPPTTIEIQRAHQILQTRGW